MQQQFPLRLLVRGLKKVAAQYPFSVKPDRLLEVGDLFAVHRSNYENTSFSAVDGLAAGAYGQPNRYGGGSFENGTAVEGNWERTISIYRSTYSSVVQARGWLPDAAGGTVWWGPHAAHATCCERALHICTSCVVVSCLRSL